MNWERLKKSVGSRVQIQPVACGLDKNGRELERTDDDWVIQGVTSDGIRICNIRTGHVTTLGTDHVHHFTTNPGRSEGGFQYGFLTLNVQVYLQGNMVWVRPNSRPGQPVSPSGATAEEQTLRARLLDERLRMVVEDYRVRGSPQPMIETFPDLSPEEKAELYDRAVLWKKGHRSTRNPTAKGDFPSGAGLWMIACWLRTVDETEC
jgi:hypothetical protein